MNAQQICSIHRKKRGVTNLIDDGAGGMRCSPGFECQVGVGKGGGNMVCSVHGKKRSVHNLVDEGQSGPGGGASYGGGGGQKKYRLCTHFQSGRCSRGSACTFAHGKLEIGTYADPLAANRDFAIRSHSSLAQESGETPSKKVNCPKWVPRIAPLRR